MIHPHVASTEDRNSVTVRYSPPPIMARRVPHISIPALLAVMYVQAMDNNVGHVLYSNAWPPGNVHICATAVDRLERIHDQLLLQLDHHAAFENDPQWLVLDHSVPKSAGFGVHRVAVTGVCHHIYFSIPSANGMLSKPN